MKTFIERLVVHEAGHAVAAHVLGGRVTCIDVTNQITYVVWDNELADCLERRAICYAAGAAAERHAGIEGYFARMDARDDYRWMRDYYDAAERRKLRGRAARLVAEHWPQVAELATLLMTCNNVSGAMINELSTWTRTSS